MNQGRARMLLSVADMDASLVFYRDQLGWELLERDEEGYTALLRIGGTEDEAVLVVSKEDTCEGSQSEKALQSYLSRWLLVKFTSPHAGSLVYIGVGSVNEIELSLRSNGCQAAIWRPEESGHIRELHVPSIDGFTFVYWEELFPSNSDIMLMYERGPDELEKAIEGLSDAQLSLKEMPDKWSIREHVLHFIDLELVAMHKVKFALAESGRLFQGNAFQPDDWQRGLAYEVRAIAGEVQLFRAARGHILGLCKHLPDALQRTIKTTTREETVAQLLKMMAGHADHHVRAVKRIRGQHGC